MMRLMWLGIIRPVNVIDPDMHQTQKCTTVPESPLAVLPVKESLVDISYIETCNHNISMNELKFYAIRDKSIRIISTKFHNILSLFGVDARC
jgi:hypothetical protein